MKAIVISDIHGDIVELQEIINKIYKYNIDKLIILGDFCSYYSDSLDIADKINDFKSIVYAVKGNADTDTFIKNIDIDLPIKRNIVINNKVITISHGHIYNPFNLPNDCGDIFLSGHTHRKLLEVRNNIIIGNPGSIGRPRDGLKSYIIIDEEKIYLKDMSDNTLSFIKLS